MSTAGKIKDFLFFYRYNIIIPSTIGFFILYDYLKLKERRRLSELQAEKEAIKKARKEANKEL